MQQIVLGMDGTSQYFSRFHLKLYKIGKHLNMFADFFFVPLRSELFLWIYWANSFSTPS